MVEDYTHCKECCHSQVCESQKDEIRTTIANLRDVYNNDMGIIIEAKCPFELIIGKDI